MLTFSFACAIAYLSFLGEAVCDGVELCCSVHAGSSTEQQPRSSVLLCCISEKGPQHPMYATTITRCVVHVSTCIISQ